jgi:calcineurin-like phosphoesterase family protein
MAFTTKFYSADFHFGHARALEWGLPSRSFASVEAMDAAIIEAVKDRVGPSDLLYVLGDFAVSNDPAYVAHCFHALPGRKVLTLGNHDVDNRGAIKPALAALPWDVPPALALETKDGGQRLWLAHYAHRVWPASHYGAWHFFGHSHGAIAPQGRSRDVGIDCADLRFRPATFAELTAGME